MTKQEIKDIIEKIITDAFIRVQNAYAHRRESYSSIPLEDNNPSSLLVYPQYFHGSPATNSEFTRVSSEQEIRFAFIEAFKDYFENRDEKLYYSVETPTVERYGFSKGKLQIYESSSTQGRSGNFDLVVHDESLNRVCLIEFKNGYPGNEKAKEGEKYREIQKDFLKLANPKENKVLENNTGETEDSLRYFVHTVTSYDKQRIEERLKEADNIIDSVIDSDAIPVNYVLLSLCRDHIDDNEKIFQDIPKIINSLKHIGFCDRTYPVLSYQKSLFVEHNYGILGDAGAQYYLCELIVDSLIKLDVPLGQITPGCNKDGTPWTHIDIVKIEGNYSEVLFWRVDRREKGYYIRLNQYAIPKDEEVWYKMYRLKQLRQAAKEAIEELDNPNLVKGELTNKGILESDIIIFFLDKTKIPQNNLAELINAIPVISKRVIETFKKLPSKKELQVVRALD